MTARDALPVAAFLSETPVSAKPDDDDVHVHLRARVTVGLDSFHMERLEKAFKKA